MAKSQIELEYQKERNRINRLIKGAEQRGFSFKDYKPPKKPKKITKKSVQFLKEITPSVLYEKATYYDPLTQTRLSGKEGQRLIRSRAQKSRKKVSISKARASKGGYTPPNNVDDVLTYVEELIKNWRPLDHWTQSYAKLKEHDKNILNHVLGGAIASVGRRQVAINCEKNAWLVKDMSFHICYGSSDFKWGSIEADLTAITAIFFGRTLDVEESKIVEEAREQTDYYESPE